MRATLQVRGVLGLTLALLSASPALLHARQAQPHRDGSGEMTLTLAGDAIITRPLSVYDEPDFLRLRELIQGSTAAFVNLEMLFHRFGPEIVPASQSGGTYMQADPEIAKELVWMGFDMVAMANNHTGDYGVEGMRSTIEAVERVGLVHAGTGENLALARAPGYLDTPRGRVALISVASTFPDASRAGPQRKDVRGRPGLNPVRFETVYQVSPTQMEALRAFQAGTGARARGGSGERLRLFGQTFQLGAEYQVLTSPDQNDLDAILASVGEADRQADLVVVSSHSHESKGSSTVPADFLVTLAHAVIDAGADVFVSHGPHVLRGVELYKGKPILYSVGDFIFQNEMVSRQPADNYESYDLGADAVPADFYDARTSFVNNPLVWEGTVAKVIFRDKEVTGIELYPLTLGHGLPRPQRGRPLLATGEMGRKILGDLRRLSEPFGTEILVENGIGVVRVSRER